MNFVLLAENSKSVHWKLGADKEVWVWVMGEHHLDKPYDVLCNEVVADSAQPKAEQEAEELRYEICEPTIAEARMPGAHSLWWESGGGLSGPQSNLDLSGEPETPGDSGPSAMLSNELVHFPTCHSRFDVDVDVVFPVIMASLESC